MPSERVPAVRSQPGGGRNLAVAESVYDLGVRSQVPQRALSWWAGAAMASPALPLRAVAPLPLCQRFISRATASLQHAGGAQPAMRFKARFFDEYVAPVGAVDMVPRLAAPRTDWSESVRDVAVRFTGPSALN